MDETRKLDPKELQRLIFPLLREGHELAEAEGLDRSELDRLDAAEVALWVGLPDTAEAAEAVDEALDLPWEDGESLRARYDGEQECC